MHPPHTILAHRFHRKITLGHITMTCSQESRGSIHAATPSHLDDQRFSQGTTPSQLPLLRQQKVRLEETQGSSVCVSLA